MRCTNTVMDTAGHKPGLYTGLLAGSTESQEAELCPPPPQPGDALNCHIGNLSHSAFATCSELLLLQLVFLEYHDGGLRAYRVTCKKQCPKAKGIK